MSFLKYLLSVTLIASILFSCQKELSIEKGKLPDEETDWEFTVGENEYKGSIDTAFITEATGFSILTMQGLTADRTTGQIIMQFFGEELVPGIYADPNVYFLYSEGGQKVYESIFDNKDFLVTITSIDSSSVIGTFSGTVEDSQGNLVTITNGKFEGVIKWEQLVIINPNPNNDDYFQVGSEWEYARENNENDRVVIRVAGDTTINVNGTPYSYRILQNTRTGEHRYFRKEGANDFYEYKLSQFGQVSDFTELDLPILKQDANEFEEWESDNYIITISGMPGVTSKLRYTITNRAPSLKLNGYQYNNVLLVDTELFTEIGGVFQYSGSGFSTVYARGVGMVIYYDLNLESFYFLRRYQP